MGERVIYATHGHIFGESSPPLLNPGSVSIPKEESWHGYFYLVMIV